jgi:hypothetical protein
MSVFYGLNFKGRILKLTLVSFLITMTLNQFNLKFNELFSRLSSYLIAVNLKKVNQYIYWIRYKSKYEDVKNRWWKTPIK